MSEKEMKIGIITHYYKSLNYGGNLQAYALCEALKKLGHTPCQISYNRSKDIAIFKHKTAFFKRACSFLKIRISRIFVSKRIKLDLEKRKCAILRFNKDSIPHTEECNQENIAYLNNNFEAFITGSDQVWHPSAVCSAYLLDFVNDGKIKLSYAASISKDDLSDEIKKKYLESLKNYKAISVREENAVDLLYGLTSKQIKWVLDPTLLLNENDWDSICTEKLIDKRYVFCYFLGADKGQRKLVEEYAKNKKLRIVTLPYLNGFYRKCDKNFGDIHLYDVGPQEFISLIKHAEYVFTDSFHAMVFSGIYKKQYFVFPRDGHLEMSSRIYSLCDLYETRERFCDTQEKCTLDYIKSLPNIDYTRQLKKLEEMREKSLNYLKENLNL